ncbi:MurR/RpiR family transcriptional regulator [Deinococcus oregonensis]|uniref:MurR/RpiR family transcriptional regulator n=1 Tax=Deinococcus oregonensis TaxID=1805970 RepID=A0ABV6B4L0_9DEIO
MTHGKDDVLAASESTESFVDHLRRSEARLTPTEKRIAAHMGLVWTELPLTSAAELAQDLGVNSSSVTRLAQSLGFRGYPDLQRQVRHELRGHHAPLPLPGESEAAAHWGREIQAFAEMQAQPEDALNRVAGLLAQAKQVYVTGARGSWPAAVYAAQLWQGIRPGVQALGEGASRRPEDWLDAGPDSVLVAFTMRRYAQSTAQLVETLTGRGVTLILITDSGLAPGARQARELLILPTPGHAPFYGPDGRFVPLALPVSLTMLLAAKLTALVGSGRLAALEHELGEHDVFAC